MKRRHSLTEADSDKCEVWKLKDVVIVEDSVNDVQSGHVIKVSQRRVAISTTILALETQTLSRK